MTTTKFSDDDDHDDDNDKIMTKNNKKITKDYGERLFKKALKCSANGQENEVLDWLEKAAKAGHPQAHVLLAEALRKPLDEGGSRFDEDLAFRYMCMAADQGCVDGIFFLGHYHMLGVGTAVNYQKSLDAFKEAATKGKSEAQYEVGKCYLEESLRRNDGGGQVLVLSVEDMQVAATKRLEAVKIVDDILDSSVEDMQVAARKWFEAAVRQGHGQARQELAVMRAQGLAFRWQEKLDKRLSLIGLDAVVLGVPTGLLDV
jgi:TPR repeat protein